jgi:hypothetical protein
MLYYVLPLTMAQVRQGALSFQRTLGPALPDGTELKVYSASPFDMETRRQLKTRFGGDIVYFFNEAAHQECTRLELNLEFTAEIQEEGLPRRRTIVVGKPE